MRRVDAAGRGTRRRTIGLRRQERPRRSAADAGSDRRRRRGTCRSRRSRGAGRTCPSRCGPGVRVRRRSRIVCTVDPRPSLRMRLLQGTADAGRLDTSRLSHRACHAVNRSTARPYRKPNRKRVASRSSVSSRCPCVQAPCISAHPERLMARITRMRVSDQGDHDHDHQDRHARRCIGSTRFGIEAHDADAGRLPRPAQPEGWSGADVQAPLARVHERAPQGRGGAEGGARPRRHRHRSPSRRSPRPRTRSPEPEAPAPRRPGAPRRRPSRRTRSTPRSYHLATRRAPGASPGPASVRSSQDATGRVSGALGGPVAPTGESRPPTLEPPCYRRGVIHDEREALTRGPHPGRRDRAEPLADPTRLRWGDMGDAAHP